MKTMNRNGPLILGSAVTCEDDTRAELCGLIVDSPTLRVSAIVVGGSVEPARVVPFELICGVSGDGVRISCTAVSIRGLAPAEPGRVLDITENTGGWGLLSLIYATDTRAETYLRLRERVLACDGAVGRVHGCQVDVGKFPGQLTALLVNVGDAVEDLVVSAPTRAITSMKGLVVLDMTRLTVHALPRFVPQPPPQENAAGPGTARQHPTV